MVAHQSFINKHYTGLYYHWCPLSQPYAGGDALLTCLGSGWEVHDDVYYEEYWHGGKRRVLIYYFVLANARQCIVMRVLTNPFIERLLYELRLRQPRRLLPQYSAGPDTQVKTGEKGDHLEFGKMRSGIRNEENMTSAFKQCDWI